MATVNIQGVTCANAFRLADGTVIECEAAEVHARARERNEERERAGRANSVAWDEDYDLQHQHAGAVVEAGDLVFSVEWDDRFCPFDVKVATSG